MWGKLWTCGLLSVVAAVRESSVLLEKGNPPISLTTSAMEKLMSTSTLHQDDTQYGDHNDHHNSSRQLGNSYYVANNEGYSQSSRIARYSIQFQGCHHIRQWNNNADDEDVKIYSKRLARFRLVPYEKCSSYNPWMDGVSMKRLFGSVDYGEYVVDMNTFVQAYVEAKMEQDSATSSSGYYSQSSNNNVLNLEDYTQCTAFNFNSGDDYGYEYYVGPFCADQGGEIRLSLFTDDTCTTLASCNDGKNRGASCYKQATGSVLPYSDKSIIQDPCVPCSSTYSYLSTIPMSKLDISQYDFSDARDSCATIYDQAGKCEKYMKYGEYNYGCDYLNSIKVGMSSDGFAIVVRRSVVADLFLAFLVISVTFLGMYIFYLRYVLRKLKSEEYANDFYVPSHLS
jgi:hypothetical protein